MALAQTRPISIPTTSSPSSLSPRSHFRCNSDAGSDLSISVPIPDTSSFPFSTIQDPFAAFQLSQRLASFSAQDVLSCNASTSSRLVVFPGNDSIESAGERLAEIDHAETWIVLKRSDGNPVGTSAALGKLKKPECAGLLGLEDLSAFFAAVFGPHASKNATIRPGNGQHDLASPPASPNAASKHFNFSKQPRACVDEARMDAIRTQLESKVPVSAAQVSNLSGRNALRHVSLTTSLNDILAELTRDDVSCVIVSDLGQGQDGAVCGILTASDVVAFLVAESENDPTLTTVFASTLDTFTGVDLHQPAAVISGERSTVDALVRMQSERLSVLAVMDPVGGIISPIESRELSQEILRSPSRKILTTPLSVLVKSLRSRHPQGTDGKDAHPAISVSSASTVGRVAALLLNAEAGGVFVVDEPRVVMTPPLSSVSASPGKELSSLPLDSDMMPLSRSVSFTPAPAQKHRRASTQFWTAPRSSFSAASNESSRPALPNFAFGSSEAARERRLSYKPEQSLSSSVSSLPAKNAGPAVTGHLRSPSGSNTRRPRSLSLAQFGMDESTLSRQFAAQAAFRSQGSWTPLSPAPGSSASSAGSPSSPFGSMLVSGFFGEVMQNGMPRRVVTMKTVLRAVLAATAATNESALEA